MIPGETSLAFYTVKNKTDKAILGVATYNVHPPKAGLYFNKIQCFCFDEQRLKPREEIDMPVRTDGQTDERAWVLRANSKHGLSSHVSHTPTPTPTGLLLHRPRDPKRSVHGPRARDHALLHLFQDGRGQPGIVLTDLDLDPLRPRILKAVADP